MKKIKQLVFVFGLLVAISSCGKGKPEQAGWGAGALDVEAYQAVEQPFSNKVTTTANLMAEEQVQLMAPITGQVLAIYFKEGARVTKGQALIRLDDRIWKAQLGGVKAELVAAEKDFSRKNELLFVGGSSQEEVDNAFAKVELLRSQLQQLQVNIDLANVTAPFSGQLGMRNFSEGAFLRQGDIITSLSADKQLKVDFTIAQIHAKSIDVNKSVLIIVDKDTLKANVYAINPIISTDTRMISVRALLDQKSDMKIKPGTFAEVLIATDIINDAILIPTQAVVPAINEQTVYLVKNGKAVRRVIQMGDRNADQVLVLAGVAVGDTVVTTGLLQIKEGMDINIQSIK